MAPQRSGRAMRGSLRVMIACHTASRMSDDCSASASAVFVFIKTSVIYPVLPNGEGHHSTRSQYNYLTVANNIENKSVMTFIAMFKHFQNVLVTAVCQLSPAGVICCFHRFPKRCNQQMIVAKKKTAALSKLAYE
ncbi:hypothetical protein CEXT_732661 [Caerostris extrusa]|uniref:Uncharacterized protein n=1 Tax=Caerostris extrusa TaxID=172846 RepID=A0AAV4R1A1_CAEEX|nr:hypothetical protein CEXT_732661 [Caerostris extrusa]